MVSYENMFILFYLLTEFLWSSELPILIRLTTRATELFFSMLQFRSIYTSEDCEAVLKDEINIELNRL